MKPLVPIVGVPPHIRYVCAECGEDFGTAERTAYYEPRGNLWQQYWCAVCAAVENRRRQD